MASIVGKVPLIQLFLATQPSMGCANAAEIPGKTGIAAMYMSSELFNPWLWRVGCDKPRLSCLTVEETADSEK